MSLFYYAKKYMYLYIYFDTNAMLSLRGTLEKQLLRRRICGALEGRRPNFHFTHFYSLISYFSTCLHFSFLKRI